MASDTASLEATPGIELLTTEQTNIGWFQIVNGRWSTQCCLIQQQAYSWNKTLDPRKHTGSIWAKKIMAHIWTKMVTVWTQRNDALHGTPKTTEAKLKAKMEPEC